MKRQLFIGFRNISDPQAFNLTKICYEGKDYFGIMTGKEQLTLKEVASLIKSRSLPPDQAVLLPVLLFG